MSEPIARRKPTCRVKGCENAHVAKGFCGKHYARGRRNGGPLALRTHERGTAWAWIHQHSTHQSDECLPWPFSRDRNGYASMHGGSASRFMCQTAHGDAPSPAHEAAHNCGNGHLACMNPTHLRWATRLQNRADRISHGRNNGCEANGQAVLSPKQVDEIRAIWRAGGTSAIQIARKFQVHRSTVYSVVRHKTWKAGGANGRLQ